MLKASKKSHEAKTCHQRGKSIHIGPSQPSDNEYEPTGSDLGFDTSCNENESTGAPVPSEMEVDVDVEAESTQSY
jgi:hypothetical protein